VRSAALYQSRLAPSAAIHTLLHEWVLADEATVARVDATTTVARLDAMPGVRA
jgi:hypothetical protein